MKSRFARFTIAGLLITASAIGQLQPPLNAAQISDRLHRAFPEGVPDVLALAQALSQPFRMYHDLKLDGYLTERRPDPSTVTYFSRENPQEEFIRFKILSEPFRGFVVSTLAGDPSHWQIQLGDTLEKDRKGRPGDWELGRLFHFEIPNPYLYQYYAWNLSPDYVRFKSVLDGPCRRTDINLLSGYLNTGLQYIISECMQGPIVVLRWRFELEGYSIMEFQVAADDRSGNWQHRYSVDGKPISRPDFLSLFDMIVNNNLSAFASMTFSIVSIRGQWPRLQDNSKDHP